MAREDRSPRRPVTSLEVVYYVAVSLDGFIATPDGGVDWLAPFEGGDEDYGYAAFYASVDAVLLGRRTCRQALSFGAWPYADKPCWVFSRRGRRELSAVPTGVTTTAASPREVVAGLERRGVGRAWLVGGGELAGSFRDQGAHHRLHHLDRARRARRRRPAVRHSAPRGWQSRATRATAARRVDGLRERHRAAAPPPGLRAPRSGAGDDGTRGILIGTRPADLTVRPPERSIPHG